MRLRLMALVLSVLVALGLAAPALASTGGEPDGNAHPNVAFLLFYAEGERFRCSATLVSPTVLLTAGHCTDGVTGSVLVSFDSVIDEEAPLKYAAAADTQAGYTDAEIASMDALSGTASTHPDYSDFTDLKNWNDLGVIVLDEPVTGISPAEIAELGTLDTINDLSKTLFTAVGYGTEVVKPESGPQKATPMSFPLIRRYVEMPGQKLTAQIIQTNGNENDNKGTGGTCTGDSGGPLLLDGEIVAVTSYGNNEKCRGVGGYQRVDIAVAQDWLAEFGLQF
jgi:Trypsin